MAVAMHAMTLKPSNRKILCFMIISPFLLHHSSDLLTYDLVSGRALLDDHAEGCPCQSPDLRMPREGAVWQGARSLRWERPASTQQPVPLLGASAEGEVIVTVSEQGKPTSPGSLKLAGAPLRA